MISGKRTGNAKREYVVGRLPISIVFRLNGKYGMYIPS
jgi:hypothetical protein